MYRSVLVLALVIFGSACSKDGSTTGEPAQAAMGLYAKGFNTLIDDPKKLIGDYFGQIPEDGPDPSSKPRLFARQNAAAADIKEARAAFAAAKKSAPAALADLAPHADAALAAIDKVAAAYDAAQQYYQAENYKDDGFARGKEIHTQMVAAARELETSLGTLEDGLSAIEDQQAAREVAKYAGRKDYSYWFRFYNMEAKKFVTAVERASTPEQRTALAAAFEPIATASKELDAFVATKGAGVQGTFKAYATTANKFSATATKLMRLVKDTAADEKAIAREREMLVQSYNNLVTMGNSLYEVEGAGALK